MDFTSQVWLNNRNQVVVKFIEILTQNDWNTNIPNQEKLFKRIVAIDAIYGSHHRKYVSEINLAALAIKYSLARSKKIINIDNHITSAEGYVRFQKWLDELSKEQESLPKRLLFLAFNNEQRGQKNYIDRRFNTVILNQLCIEKLSSNNSIDTFIGSMMSNNGYDKYCLNFAELQKQNASELLEINSQNKLTKPILFKPHTFKNESKISHPQISITQRSVADNGVCIPEIYIPDPLNINPNSIANVEKEKFPWLVLIPGQLHEEINMLQVFVELNWKIDLKKVADEEQLMRLHPTIRDLVEKNSVISRSGLINQHQGLDAILEEVNKALKTLIPSVLQQHHWEIAAHNCKKFLQLHNNFFKIIGYNDAQANSPRTHPESVTEYQRFQVYLRKLNFLNLMEVKTDFKSLGEEFKLSDQLKNFIPSFRPIPITQQEAIAQKDESKMTRIEILRKLESFLELMSESIRKQYCGIGFKKKNELLTILQVIQNLQSVDNETVNIDVV
ncbi:hypothetical protein GLOIN_2v1770734 [Rhizophagus clarus]|uniref:Uncharacterized protein n=1 Tax=Rhizophagus clarus TaxID=94130 RepID=A0A8H3QJK5_9GLOM|nr:hypothetical protein GLOIN_2v1770734 [Rhizophagus clarus]